jgi:hypothetical protein
LRAELHIVLHVLVPGLVALGFYRRNFWRAWILLCLAMLVDIDHLLADPVYDPGRCSIGFHPLHSEIAIAAYGLAVLAAPLRLFAIGLLVHMALDGIDCLLM